MKPSPIIVWQDGIANVVAYEICIPLVALEYEMSEETKCAECGREKIHGVDAHETGCSRAWTIGPVTPEKIVEFSEAYVPRADFDEALVLLKDAEWASFQLEDEGQSVFSSCQECRRQKRSGSHAPDCRLAAFLAKWGK